jgi:hypothetical protein
LLETGKARSLGKAGGFTIFVGSLILFFCLAAIGWVGRHSLTAGGFFMFATVGVLIAVASSRHGYADPEDAAKRAALVGYKASEEMKMKYAESLSSAILLWLVLLPTYTAFFILYTYFLVEPIGTPSSAYGYVFAGASLPVIFIYLFVEIACFYLRGSELRKFARSAVKGSRMARAGRR